MAEERREKTALKYRKRNQFAQAYRVEVQKWSVEPLQRSRQTIHFRQTNERLSSNVQRLKRNQEEGEDGLRRNKQIEGDEY